MKISDMEAKLRRIEGDYLSNVDEYMAEMEKYYGDDDEIVKNNNSVWKKLTSSVHNLWKGIPSGDPDYPEYTGTGPWKTTDEPYQYPSVPYIPSEPLTPPASIPLADAERKVWSDEVERLKALIETLKKSVADMEFQRRKEREQLKAKEAELKKLFEQMTKMREEFNKALKEAEEQIELAREAERKSNLY